MKSDVQDFIKNHQSVEQEKKVERQKSLRSQRSLRTQGSQGGGQEGNAQVEVDELPGGKAQPQVNFTPAAE